MRRLVHTSKEIREFILENVEKHPEDIAALVRREFGLSRQAASFHIRRLVRNGLLVASGQTKGRRYELAVLLDEVIGLAVDGLEEHVVWRESVYPLLENSAPDNVLRICQYGVEEMVNNVIDHSESENVMITVKKTATTIVIYVADFGIGIFNKIQSHFNLHDPRHALLELAKGKLTSDPSTHTGQGVFFTSRMFDKFTIASGSLYYSRENLVENEEWLIEVEDIDPTFGTWIRMEIRVNAPQTTTEVFDKFTSDEDFTFSRTQVPIQLVQYEGDNLLSRSQARRITAHVDKFREVLLDFKGVTEIGHSFADEIFRVYHSEHPQVRLIPVSMSAQVASMVRQAQTISDSAEQPRLFDISD